jgi:putative flippase GtrA
MRWVRFNIVGGLGVFVQAIALWLLADLLKLNYLIATVLAVEATILHNFAWHVNWTFSDRRSLPAQSGMVERNTNDASFRGWRFSQALFRFQFASGVVCIPGNLVIMWLLVKHAQLPHLPANLLAIAVCSIANYYLTDKFSFPAHLTSDGTGPD